MKILVLTNSYPSAKNPASGIFVAKQIGDVQRLAEDAEFHVCSNPLFKWIKNPVGPKRPLWLRLLGGFGISAAFAPHLFRRYDLVHAHQMSHSGVLGAIHKLAHRTPLVITCHGADLENFHTRREFAKKLTTWALESADRVISVSRAYCKQLVTDGLVDHTRLECISCGTDVEFFERKEPKSALQVRLGLDPSRFHILFVGGLIPKKDPQTAIDACCHLAGQLQLTIIGEGPLRDELVQRAAPISDRVLFKKFMPHEELRAWMQAADCLVFPSVLEAFGLVAVEAMASGTPVVASPVGGKLDVIQNEETGLFFETGNAADLASKLQRLMTDNELLQRLTRNAPAGAKAWDAPVQAAKMLQLYRDVLERERVESYAP